MGRPRKENHHLPKYVRVERKRYWYRPPDKEPINICEVGDERALYTFMAGQYEAPPMEPGEEIFMRDIFKRYLLECVPLMKEATQKDYRRIVRRLTEVFGHMRPEDIKKRHVAELLRVTEKKVAANRRVSVLSSVFSKAVNEWFLTENNPCIGMKLNRVPKNRRFVTWDEYRAVWRIAGPRIQIAMDLAVLTGQRQSDILKLKWDDVDTIGTPRKDWGIYFEQDKTGTRRKVKIGPSLEEVLQRAKKMLPHVPRTYVVRNEQGHRYTTSGFRSCWQRLMSQAMKGVWKSGQMKRGETVRPLARQPVLTKRFRFHDLRKKAASESKSLQAAFELLGHSNIAMTKTVYDVGFREVESIEFTTEPGINNAVDKIGS